VSHLGEVHPSRGYVGRHENGGFSLAEELSGCAPLALGETRVYFVDTGFAKGTSRRGCGKGWSLYTASQGFTHIIEYLGSEGGFCGGVKVDDRFERTVFGGPILGCSNCALAKFQESRQQVFKAGNGHHHLFYTLVGGFFVPVYRPYIVKVRLHDRSCKLYNLFWDSCRKHESLAVRVVMTGKELLYHLDFGPESLVEESIGFV